MTDPSATYQNIQPPTYYALAALPFLVLGVAGVQLFSLLLWLAGALLLYSATDQLRLSPTAQTVSLAVYCFLPGWTWISCAVSTDVLLAFWGALMVWLVVRGRPFWAMALLVAICAGTKVSGLVLVLLPLVVYGRRWLRFTIPAACVSAALIIRNLSLWGDLTGQQYVGSLPIYDTVWQLGKHYVRTFFMAYGSDSFSSIEYRLFWPALLAFFVWLLAAWRRIPLQHRRLATACSLLVLVASLAVIANGLEIGRAQGRLGYVALPALCLYAGIAAETGKVSRGKHIADIYLRS